MPLDSGPVWSEMLAHSIPGNLLDVFWLEFWFAFFLPSTQEGITCCQMLVVFLLFSLHWCGVEVLAVKVQWAQRAQCTHAQCGLVPCRRLPSPPRAPGVSRGSVSHTLHTVSKGLSQETTT